MKARYAAAVAVALVTQATFLSGAAVAQETTTTTANVGARARYFPAIVRGNHWFIRQSVTTGVSTSDFFFGDVGDQKLLCDWNGDGTRTPGVRRGITFYLRDGAIPNGTGAASDRPGLNFGNLGDVPICGDWDGDGDETIGVVRNDAGTLKWFMHNSNVPGESVRSPVFFFGSAGDTPIVGNWDGAEGANPGVRRGISFLLRNSNTNGVADQRIDFGDPTDVPIVGNWDGAQGDNLGVFRGGTWFLRNSNNPANPSLLVPPFGFGQGGDVPRVAAYPS